MSVGLFCLYSRSLLTLMHDSGGSCSELQQLVRRMQAEKVSLSCFLPVLNEHSSLPQQMKQLWEAARSPLNAADCFEVDLPSMKQLAYLSGINLVANGPNAHVLLHAPSERPQTTITGQKRGPEAAGIGKPAVAASKPGAPGASGSSVVGGLPAAKRPVPASHPSGCVAGGVPLQPQRPCMPQGVTMPQQQQGAMNVRHDMSSRPTPLPSQQQRPLPQAQLQQQQHQQQQLQQFTSLGEPHPFVIDDPLLPFPLDDEKGVRSTIFYALLLRRSDQLG